MNRWNFAAPITTINIKALSILTRKFILMHSCRQSASNKNLDVNVTIDERRNDANSHQK